VLLRRFRRDRRGASEIVGTALFLVILFFFFTNVFLWHDQVTREMDQVVVDRMNSGVRIGVNSTELSLEVTNVGGLDLTLSRLWIITDDDHVYADFEPYSIHVAGGSRKKILLWNVTDVDDTVYVAGSTDQILVTNGVDLIVNYDPSGKAVTFRVLTKRANTAACSLTL
jgi:hypothetical protein